MNIRLRLFSIYREIFGTGTTTISLPDGAPLKSLLERLFIEYPRLKSFEKSLTVAINREFASLGEKLNDGDEVALMPPVGGG